jgi:redox-sensitive bicupin YhaK (pirin superfamily)
MRVVNWDRPATKPFMVIRPKLIHTSQMNLAIKKSADRGWADHGWLKSRHTFSFGDYYDRAAMGFRSLRVINQDVVAPGGGFPTHPHRDMEIFSYVLDGTLEHNDSLGNGRRLLPGQIQLMSAGSGVQHSEFNPSTTEPLHFLQIWIQPHTRGLQPSYTEWQPEANDDSEFKTLVISPDGHDRSATINQDARVYRIQLPAGAMISHPVEPGRGIWLQTIRGSVTANETPLGAGDAVHTDDSGTITLSARDDAEALLFDLA